ncbi:MAG TPA: hypothetical protein VGG61_00020 [Gemmataceae bacterium]
MRRVPQLPWLVGGLVAFGLMVPVVSAQKDEAKSEPPGAHVEAKLTAKKTTYVLDLGGKSSEEFKKAIAAGAASGDYPEPSQVDLTLELVNTSDKDVRIRVGGTTTVINLELMGKGAVSVPLKNRATNKLAIAPKVVTIAPGKSTSVPITSLAYGFKNATDVAYWTEAGEYSLTASYKTWISPAPKDAKDAGDGFCAVTLISAPIKLTVEAKK